MWTFLKSLLNLLQYCFCFMFLFFWPRGMWDLSSPTRDRICTPCIERRSLNHWTAREIPSSICFGPFLRMFISLFTLSFCSCMFSAFSVKALRIVIIILKNSWSDKSNISAMSDSGSDACLRSSNCAFCLLVCLVIFC